MTAASSGRIRQRTLRGHPRGRGAASPTPSPPGTEAGPRTPGFRWCPRQPSAHGPIPGSSWTGEVPGRKEDTLAALAAPAAAGEHGSPARSGRRKNQ
ncbi:Hypothetical protein HVPorG_04986 [Roseomonas mucosa]|nr:Hypothetical protein HVPorG_04986 [Roseomonas mucosa]